MRDKGRVLLPTVPSYVLPGMEPCRGEILVSNFVPANLRPTLQIEAPTRALNGY